MRILTAAVSLHIELSRADGRQKRKLKRAAKGRAEIRRQSGSDIFRALQNDTFNVTVPMTF
jgi:hypothetical protein